MEQDFPFILDIHNATSSPIAFCSPSLAATCPNMVQAGAAGHQIFMGHLRDGSDDERFAAFDRQKVKVCGKLIDLQRIRQISAVTKRSSNNYDIEINERVIAQFCQR